MSTHDSKPERRRLRTIAEQAALARSFRVTFPIDTQSQLQAEREPSFESLNIRDFTSWLWSSIDNDESKDLDQIEYAQKESGGIRIYVGIADVDWFVSLNSALDRAAEHNTASIYTGVETFPMLPDKLSTDLSSLNEARKRLAVVVEMRVLRKPERWDRIVSLAASLGTHLAAEPDVRSLAAFLKQQQRTNPAHFADLSLAVIKLLGRGEYVLKSPGDEP